MAVTNMDVFQILIPFGLALAFGLASSMLYNVGNRGLGISKNVFLVGTSIAVFILIWKEALPVYFALVGILFLVLTMVGDIGGDEYE